MPLYCGRLSEVAYIALHRKWFDQIPDGFARLVDKGFARTTKYYKMMNHAFVPAFVRSDSKDLSGASLKEARKQSSDRYTCETYFARSVNNTHTYVPLELALTPTLTLALTLALTFTLALAFAFALTLNPNPNPCTCTCTCTNPNPKP